MVSVIIPTYNYGKYISEAIESLQQQSYSDWECIVVDDGSTDNTRQIVLTLQEGDKRINYFLQENSGPSVARNYGISKAKGEYILFLDADDILEKDKLKSHIEALNKNDDVDIAYGDVRYFLDGKPNDLFYSLKPENKPWTTKYSGNGIGLLNLVLKQNIMVTSSPLVKKEVLQKAGAFDAKLLKLEDWELFQRWAINDFVFQYVDSTNSLVLMRAHPTSFSYDKKGMRVYFLPILEKHFAKSSLGFKNRLYVIVRMAEEFTDLFLASIFRNAELPKHYNTFYGFILPIVSIVFLPFYLIIKIFRLFRKSN